MPFFKLTFRPQGWIIGIAMLCCALQSYAQCNTHNIDLSTFSADYTWNSGTLSRGNQCCAATAAETCIRFNVTLNPNTVAIRFFYIGAPAYNSETWQLNCGTQYNLRDTICLTGAGVQEITFCKPGGGDYEYIIQAIAQPSVGEADSVRIGCTHSLNAYGMIAGSISWNSITGTAGQYNHYLSAINADRPKFTADSLSPTFIDYEVCGLPVATACGYTTIPSCDTIRVYVFPELAIDVNPYPAYFCNTGVGSNTTLSPTVTGGIAPYTFQWFNPFGVAIGNNSTVSADMQGNYTLEISDYLTRGICPSVKYNIPVVEYLPPVVDAGADQIHCTASPNIILNGTIQFADAGLWSGGAGIFTPNNTVHTVSYAATAAEISTGFVDLYLESSTLGCNIVRDTIRINFTDSILVNLNATPLLCATDESTISATASGGFSLYNYQWNNGATTSTLTQSAGNYTVTVTDASGRGCKTVSSITVTAPPSLSIALSSNDISADGLCDGDATATPIGGTAPYNYIWDDGQTTSTAIGYCYGIHSVTVSDANGCMVNNSLVINSPLCNALQVTVDSSAVNCYGDDYGELYSNVSGGTMPYTYLWNTMPAQNSDAVFGLRAGVYGLTVTDDNGCVQIAQGVISEPTKLANFFTTVNINTVGSNDGEATANVSGGVQSYNYNWENGEFTPTVTGLAAGMHQFYIVDSHDCLLFDSVYIAELPCGDFIVSTTTQNPSCNGYSDGEATVYGIGGLAPYSFLWDSGHNTSTASGLTIGDYMVTVTDANGCTQVASVTLSEPDFLVVELVPTDISCFGSNDGAIETIVFGGTFPYSFQWSNGSNMQNLSQLGSDDYFITATDANGCSFVSGAFIYEPDEIVLTAIPTDPLCANSNTGYIGLVSSGGFFPYTYQWSTGENSENIYNLASGVYAVTMTDANGCETTLISFIDQPDSLAITGVDIECSSPSVSTANITVHAIGGTAPYQYSIDNGVTFGAAGDSIISVSSGQIHAVIIRDAVGCLLQNAFAINVPAVVNIDSIAFAACYPVGTTNTSIQILPSGGIGTQYQVSIDNGANYAAVGVYDFVVLITTEYRVILRDSLGCQSDTATIILPSPFDASNTPSNYNGFGVSCASATDGSIDISTIGGTAPYIYNWNDGQTSEDISGIGAGIYSVTITDANNCQVIQNITLTEPSAISLTITEIEEITCNGAADGKAAVVANGGIGTFDYLWSNGQNVDIATGLSAGVYTVTVTDDNGCVAIESITITEQNAVTLIISVTSNYNGSQISCNGDTDGKATAIGNGGIGTLNYLWSSGQNTADATDLAAGIYSVTVTDANGCTATENVSVTEPSAITLTVSETAQITCNGAADGEATAIANGGTGTLDFAWSNGQNTALATGLAAGVYSVTTTDNNGCFATENITLTEPSVISLTISETAQITCNGAADGEATAIANGGTGALNFTWSNGQNTAIATGLTAGLYSVTSTDTNGCFAIENITLTEPSAISLTVTETAQITCNGAADGEATAIANGGTGALNFAWSNGQNTAIATGLTAGIYSVTSTDANGCFVIENIILTEPSVISLTVSETAQISCNGAADGEATAIANGGTGALGFAWSNGQNTALATGLAAGVYSVTTTDNNGCFATENITLTEPSAISLTINETAQITCNGAADGEATAIANGGTGALNFAWSNGQNTALATGLAAGVYSVTATDANGCMAIENITLTEPSVISLTVSETAQITCNGAADGEATAIANGGTGALNFAWSNGQNTAIATGLTAGIYSVTATDANGCMAIENITLTEPSLITLTVSETAQITCNGAANGEATAIANGGTGALDFLWSNGQNTAIATGLTAGIYSVTTTDANGCFAIENITLTEPSAISLTVSETAQITCNGAADGEATAIANGGTGALDFLWSNGQNTAIATGLAAGVYSVTSTDTNGCMAIENITLTEPSLISLTVSETAQITCNGAADGEATAIANGGTGALDFAWSNGQNTAIATGLTAGIYSVTSTDANGCMAIGNINITEPNLVTLTVSETAQITCNGAADGEATAIANGGTGALDFAWSNGQNTAIATGLTAGVYSVTATDTNGCFAIENITITESSVVTLTVSVTSNYNGSEITCNGAADGEATVISASAMNFVWSNGQSTAIATGLTAGVYSVTATDTNGCFAIGNINITEPNLVTLTVSETAQITCNGAADGEATAIGNGGTGILNFLWSNGQNTAITTGLTAGNYTVMMSDANNCFLTETININEPSAITLTVNSTAPISCNGATDGEATAIANGGTGALDFAWSNGQNTALATGLTAGVYSVTSTDANGCFAIENITLTEPSLISLTISETAQITCNGAADGEATAIGNGGTGALNFAWSNGQNTAIATGLTAGIYSVTTTDANGCMAIENITLTEPSAISLTVSETAQITCNGAADGEATAIANGGTGALDFAWSNGQNTAIATGLTAGVYSVTATDNNGCFAIETITLTEPSVISLTVNSTAQISCNGAADGEATAIGNGGTGTLNFAWSNGQNTALATGLIAGIYSVTSTDNNGCFATETITLTEPSALVPVIAIIQNVSCNGFNDGSMTATATGGTGTHSFIWNNAETTSSISGLSGGVYSVTVTDSNGCEVSNDASIEEPATLIIEAVTNHAICTLSNGNIDITMNGGTTPYNFLWSDGILTEDRLQVNIGHYALTVTDNNGCEAVWADSILQINVALDLIANVQSGICYRANTGSIELRVGNSLAPFNYEWSNGMTDSTLTELEEGTYFVTVTDANGCTATDFYNIQVLEDTLFLDLNSPLFDNGFNLSSHSSNDGSIESILTGGVAAYSYEWSNAANVENLEGLPSGFYSLTVTDANGCTVSDTITLSSPMFRLPAMPEGISPNGDGLNDKFVVRNIEFYPKNTLVIYNRWGEELLRFDGYINQWEGENARGKALPRGTYFVMLWIEVDGEEMLLKGHVDIRP